MIQLTEHLTATDSFDAVMSALFEFQQTVKPVVKDSENPHFRSKYADLAAIQEEIAEPLKAAGLTYSQPPVGRGEVVTILSHVKSGQWLMSRLDLVPDNATAQQSGSAITYAKRYALCSILGLRLDSDDDGNAASVATQTKQQAAVRETKVAQAKAANEARAATPTDTFKAVYERMEAYEPKTGDARKESLVVLGRNGYTSFKEVKSGSDDAKEIITALGVIADAWKKTAELTLQPSDAQ